MQDQLVTVLQSVDRRPTPASYLAAARQVAQLSDLPPVRVALLSSFTIDPLKPFLQVEAARQQLLADIYVARFNQARQELLDPGSATVLHRPDVVLVTELLSDVCPSLSTDVLTLSETAADVLIEETVENLRAAIVAFRRSSAAAVVIHGFTGPRSSSLGLHDGMAERSIGDRVHRLNRRLSRVLPETAGVFVLDTSRVAAEIGHRHWYDDRMWFLARTPLTAGALEGLAREQARYLRVLRKPARKVLALDLDNTLWGGIVGESGVAGLALGHDYPGNTYRHFQEVVLDFYRQGVLLAVVSKNNPGDVEEVFRTHPSMVLRPEHFAATRINWLPKPDNLASIAEELALGLDSFVFVDDSAVECELMRQALPDVLTLQVPDDPTRLPSLVSQSGVFDRLSLTSEDLRRGQLYRERSARANAAQASGSLDGFLSGLEMTATIRPVDQFAFPRVVNLLEKTNQFNLTTRRHSAGEVAAMMNDPNAVVFYLQLTDRFGDHGIVGVAIAIRRTDVVEIDSLLLSCRVIGRDAETALLARVVDWGEQHGCRLVEGEFIRTLKNAPAADFYVRHGFRNVSDDGRTARWQLTIAETPIQWPQSIQLCEATA